MGLEMIRFEDFISKDTNGDTNGDYVHTAKSVCVCFFLVGMYG